MTGEFGKLIVFPDAEALARGAGLWLNDRIAPLQGRIAIALSGGSTPRRLCECKLLRHGAQCRSN